jgi:DNA-binding PadR family transcriptional regulator
MRSSPVPPVAYALALVLSDGPLHPYALNRAIDKLQLNITASQATVYRYVDRMLVDGWLRELAGTDGDQYRRMVCLTESGRMAVIGETTRMRALVEVAENRGLS